MNDEKIKLIFTLTVDVQRDYADELGEDIAFDLLCEMRDGDDEIGWEYVGYEVVE